MEDESHAIDLETHERQLDRIQAFFPRIDNKMGVIFAVPLAEIAIAAINMALDDFRIWWIDAILVIFIAFAIFILANLYKCAYPHIRGGHGSLVYFGEISKLREVEYVTQYSKLTNGALKADIAAQIWRNSEIVCVKYGYLKNAMIGASVSTVPWAAFLIATAFAHGRMPIIKS